MRRGLLLLGLLGCAAETDKTSSDSAATPDATPAASPAALGPYAIGTQDFIVTGRTGVELVVQVWYPTEGTGKLLYSYMGAYTGLAQETPAPACEEMRPMMAFSHGNTGLRWQSLFWTEYLASHGFVVVAPDHTGNTIFDDDTSRRSELIFRRPWDISDSVDHLLAAGDDVVDGLSDCLDPDAGFAVSGHSFGGYTTMAVAGASYDSAATRQYCETADWWLCEEALSREESDAALDGADDRVWAAIPMAPAGFEVLLGGLSDIDIPVMVIGGSADQLTPMEWQVAPIYDALQTTPKMLGSLTDAGHFLFSNACDLIGGENDECRGDYLESEVGHPEVATTGTAFLRWVLGEDSMADHLPQTPQMWTWTVD
jgi:predicted dienelactone hydrolase